MSPVETTPPQPAAVNLAALIEACQKRLGKLQAVHEEQNDSCAVLRQKLEQAEAQRADTASRGAELAEHIEYLKHLSNTAHASTPPASPPSIQ